MTSQNKYLFLRITALSLILGTGLFLLTGSVLGASPDLEVSGVVRSSTVPAVGDSVRFDVYVKNIGDSMAAGSQARVRLDAGGNGDFENTLYQPTSPVPAGETQIVSFFWTPSASGLYRVESCADNGNAVSESNESNNCFIQSFNVEGATTQTPPPAAPSSSGSQQTSSYYSTYYSSSYSAPSEYIPQRADLSVSDIYASPRIPALNQTTLIGASIHNNSGLIRADAFYTSIKIYYNGGGEPVFNQSQYLDYVATRDYRVVSFYWTPKATGNHKIEICADSNNDVVEANENNNCSTYYVDAGGETATNSRPTVSFYSVPTTIIKGNSSLLVWSSADADSCSASNGWSGAKNISGTEAVYPTSSQTYIITCTNSYGQSSASANVTSLSMDGTAATQNLIASCVASPQTASTGQSIIFAAGQSGAVGTPYYTWSGDIAGSGLVKGVSFNSVGTKTATMTVTDSAGRTARAQCQTKITTAKIVAAKKTAVVAKSIVQAQAPICPAGCITTSSCAVINPNNSSNINSSDVIYEEVTDISPKAAITVGANSLENKTAATVLIGISGVGKFFVWSLIILFNLLLLAALFYLIKVIRNQLA